MADPTIYEKHTTHTDALDTLGTIIGPDEKRDAIHLAVYPVEAGERLGPGTDVLLEDGRAWRAYDNDGVGIVDPFLDGTVVPGERFWLVVYPRQITSLRHVWEHPAFPQSDAALRAELDEAQLRSIEARNPGIDMDEVRAIRATVGSAVGQQAASEAWLREWVDGLDTSGPYEDEDPRTAFEVITSAALKNPAEMHIGFDITGAIPAEFWLHLAVWSGQTIPAERAEYFSCAC
jgi:hypothetical protein